MNVQQGHAAQPARPPGTAALVLTGAARAVAAVLEEGASAEDALAAQLTDLHRVADPHRAAIQAVSLGALRWYGRLAPAVLPLLAKPGGRTEPQLRALLICAVHQLEYSTHAAATTVAAAVDAARLLGFERAAGLVNAVLRRYLREREARLAAVDRDLPARTAHPEWLVAAMREAWPKELEQILAANNAHPPLAVRVDIRRLSLTDYLAQLAQLGSSAEAVPGVATAAILAAPVPVDELPGFAEGMVSVQDPGAQFAALLLAPRQGERVLDACAAPGGKTGALLEVATGPIHLTAADSDAQRLARVADNLKRLQRAAVLVHSDLRATPNWWDGQAFDAILLDAPCSGTGVIRRHPDIKLLRRASDIHAFAVTQLALLRGCWVLLRPGGRLLYVTCSVLPAENAEVIAAFLADESTAREAPLPAAAAVASLHSCLHGWQRLPGAGGDGFYYACLTKADP